MFTSTIIATFKLPLSYILEANVVHSFVNPCYWCNLSIFWWLDPEWRRLLSTSQEQTQGKDHQGQGESAGLQPGPGAFSGLWGASTMTSLQAINITMSDVVQHEHKVLAPFFLLLFGKGDFCSCVLFSSPFQDSKILKPGCWPRPPVNYCILIALALKSSHSGSLKVQQIYHFTRSEFDDLLEPLRFMCFRIKSWRLTFLQTADVFTFVGVTQATHGIRL